jgi:hypothetical protein
MAGPPFFVFDSISLSPVTLSPELLAFPSRIHFHRSHSLITPIRSPLTYSIRLLYPLNHPHPPPAISHSLLSR